MVCVLCVVSVLVFIVLECFCVVMYGVMLNGVFFFCCLYVCCCCGLACLCDLCVGY